MNADDNLVCKSWYEGNYSRLGFAAQRLYPNEELLRFFGRHYFSLAPEQRRKIRVLETGCGSGANLWMIAREGFDTHGIDLSPAGLDLCEKMLAHWGTSATTKAADMTTIPYPDHHFDVVLEVFSANCFDERHFARYLDEVMRVLRSKGRFFSYAPSKASDAFRNPGSARLIDCSTFDAIKRKSSAYYGEPYPFRFISPAEYEAELKKRELRVIYNEIVARTYRRGEEYFEFVVIVGEKQ